MSHSYTVYLLHFSPAYRHAQHYLGLTRDGRPVEERLKEHRSGSGARLTRAASKAGCELIVARVWENAPFGFEMKTKGRSLRPLCPICRGVA